MSNIFFTIPKNYSHRTYDDDASVNKKDLGGGGNNNNNNNRTSYINPLKA